MRTQPPAGCARLYRPRSLLASGGYGSVYLAHQESLDRLVAVKLLHRGHLAAANDVARFMREAKVTAALVNPHIVRVFDHGYDDGIPWIVFEYIEGPTVRSLLNGGALPMQTALLAGRQMANALHAAHTAGILHRDIKPENIMQAAGDLYKLTDFGLASWNMGTNIQTEQGFLLGTPAYLPPERIRGEDCTPQSDIYMLGVTLYELVTGRLPFMAPTVQSQLVQHLNEEPVPPSRHLSDLPLQLDRIILQALAKDPERRWEKASALEEALTTLSGELVAGPARTVQVRMRPATRATDVATTSSPRPFQARSWWNIGLIVTVLTLGFFLVREQHTRPGPMSSLEFGYSQARMHEQLFPQVPELRRLCADRKRPNRKDLDGQEAFATRLLHDIRTFDLDVRARRTFELPGERELYRVRTTMMITALEIWRAKVRDRRDLRPGPEFLQLASLVKELALDFDAFLASPQAEVPGVLALSIQIQLLGATVALKATDLPHHADFVSLASQLRQGFARGPRSAPRDLFLLYWDCCAGGFATEANWSNLAAFIKQLVKIHHDRMRDAFSQDNLCNGIAGASSQYCSEELPQSLTKVKHLLSTKHTPRVIEDIGRICEDLGRVWMRISWLAEQFPYSEQMSMGYQLEWNDMQRNLALTQCARLAGALVAPASTKPNLKEVAQLHDSYARSIAILVSRLESADKNGRQLVGMLLENFVDAAVFAPTVVRDPALLGSLDLRTRLKIALKAVRPPVKPAFQEYLDLLIHAVKPHQILPFTDVERALTLQRLYSEGLADYFKPVLRFKQFRVPVHQKAFESIDLVLTDGYSDLRRLERFHLSEENFERFDKFTPAEVDHRRRQTTALFPILDDFLPLIQNGAAAGESALYISWHTAQLRTRAYLAECMTQRWRGVTGRFGSLLVDPAGRKLATALQSVLPVLDGVATEALKPQPELLDGIAQLRWMAEVTFRPLSSPSAGRDILELSSRYSAQLRERSKHTKSLVYTIARIHWDTMRMRPPNPLPPDLKRDFAELRQIVHARGPEEEAAFIRIINELLEGRLIALLR